MRNTHKIGLLLSICLILLIFLTSARALADVGVVYIPLVMNGYIPNTVSGPALYVDAAAQSNPISPYIYGMAFASEELAAELRLPLRTWNGNATSRYNWQTDTSNRANDWFFENIPNDHAYPAQLPVGSAADRFVQQDRRTGTASLLTAPMIGWVPAERCFACGFSVTKYGPQLETDPWAPDCGNGIRPDGTPITGNSPTDTSKPVTAAFVQDWLWHLIGQFGTAADGGVRFFNMDNEPMLWHITHRDVHPDPTSYDEIMARAQHYAPALKAVDPSVQILGPTVWGWTAYFWSALDWASGTDWKENPQDRLAHDDIPFLEWYLQQMQSYEQQHGLRILDYLDVHYYPQAQDVALAPAGNVITQELRLRSTRSLWDPKYVDESWINEPVYLIPRMRAWVNSNYPGTKISISEYNWGALDHINGALAQADVLGIFGREGLDLASLWDPPKPYQPGAYAFRMYLNYDGRNSAFGDVSVQASSQDQDQLAIYAARRTSDGALTLMVINKTTQTLSSRLTIANLGSASQAQVYRYSASSLYTIAREADVKLQSSGARLTLPAQSITLVVVPG